MQIVDEYFKFGTFTNWSAAKETTYILAPIRRGFRLPYTLFQCVHCLLVNIYECALQKMISTAQVCSTPLKDGSRPRHGLITKC